MKTIAWAAFIALLLGLGFYSIFEPRTVLNGQEAHHFDLPEHKITIDAADGRFWVQMSVPPKAEFSLDEEQTHIVCNGLDWYVWLEEGQPRRNSYNGFDWIEFTVFPKFKEQDGRPDYTEYEDGTYTFSMSYSLSGVDHQLNATVEYRKKRQLGGPIIFLGF